MLLILLAGCISKEQLVKDQETHQSALEVTYSNGFQDTLQVQYHGQLYLKGGNLISNTSCSCGEDSVIAANVNHYSIIEIP